MLRNVKTKWLSILGPTLHVLEYNNIITKMAIDGHKDPLAKKNLKLLLEWEMMLALQI